MGYEYEFNRKRGYDELIRDLQEYFNYEKNPIRNTELNTNRVKIERIVDQKEVDRLNEKMKLFYIQENDTYINNSQVSLEDLISRLKKYDDIENIIKKFYGNEKEVFYNYFCELKSFINDINNNYEKYKNPFCSNEKDDIFQEIVDDFKNNILSEILVGRFIDKITEKINESEIYKSLLKTVNEYMSSLGIYTQLLQDNFYSSEVKLFSVLSEYTDDNTKHKYIKEVLKLPYCFNYSTDSKKIKKVNGFKGQLICYSNRINDK